MSTKTKDKDAAKDAAADGEKKGGKKKLVLVLAVLLVVVGAAVYFFLFTGEAEAKEPVAGEVVTLEPVTVNLAGGGYLKVGISLQTTEDAAAGGHGGGGVDGSKALDLVISTYSQAQPADVSGAREALKESLEHQIVEAYTEHEVEMVMGIYFTEYVTQ